MCLKSDDQDQFVLDDTGDGLSVFHSATFMQQPYLRDVAYVHFTMLLVILQFLTNLQIRSNEMQVT